MKLSLLLLLLPLLPLLREQASRSWCPSVSWACEITKTAAAMAVPVTWTPHQPTAMGIVQLLRAANDPNADHAGKGKQAIDCASSRERVCACVGDA